MRVNEFEPGARLGGGEAATPSAAHERLAARLRAAASILAALEAESDARIRLNSRFVAICTALKVPGASVDSCTDRLDNLIADAEHARAKAGK